MGSRTEYARRNITCGIQYVSVIYTLFIGSWLCLFSKLGSLPRNKEFLNCAALLLRRAPPSPTATCIRSLSRKQRTFTTVACVLQTLTLSSHTIAAHLAPDEAKSWLPRTRAPRTPSVLLAQHPSLFVPVTEPRPFPLRRTNHEVMT